MNFQFSARAIFVLGKECKRFLQYLIQKISFVLDFPEMMRGLSELHCIQTSCKMAFQLCPQALLMLFSSVYAFVTPILSGIKVVHT